MVAGIGYEIAKRASLGFNCKVLYHNRNRRPDAVSITLQPTFVIN